MWEQEPDNSINLIGGGTTGGAMNLESGDTTHATPGFQIYPPMIQQATKTIQFFAVVSDPGGIADVQNGEVFGYVYHPNPSPKPYSDLQDPQGNDHFKYKVIYTQDIGYGATAIADVLAASNAGLINFGPIAANDPNNSGTGNYTLADLTNSSKTGELDKRVAELWMGTEVITYEQPAGLYTVYVAAQDKEGNISPSLKDNFTYKPLTGVEIDFNQINYPSTSVRGPVNVPGDITWNSPTGINHATVRNIGNTWAQVTVAQDDMAFGKVGSMPATSYQGTVPPIYTSNPTNTATQSNWNVYFDAQLGQNTEMFYDPTAKGSPMTNVVTLPGVLGLSSLDELDFSICVVDALAGTRTGSMTISSVTSPFSDYGIASNSIPSH
jgi:hypothetical protein